MKTMISAACVAVTLLAGVATSQKPSQRQTPKPVIFAVLESGGTLEPIGYLTDKKLESAVDGASEPEVLKAFHTRYYKPRTSYAFVFGGAKAGLVAIKSADPDMECSRHTAAIISAPTRAKLKGNVMGLAVTSSINPTGSGTRRMPTAAERSEIEALVRAEFAKNKIGASVLKKLKYQNLTALDLDDDGVVEFVGSYWVEPTPKTRALLFFIADKNVGDKYTFPLTEFDSIKEEDTMSSDITTVDSGVGHELLLDVLDYDGDGSAEIFTYSPSFEGAGFNVYSRKEAKWTKVYESANYRCAY